MQGFREDVCLVFFYSNDDFTYYSFVKYVCSMRLDVNGGNKVRNSEILSKKTLELFSLKFRVKKGENAYYTV